MNGCAKALPCLAIALAFASPGVARAEPADVGHAEALFNTAMKMMDARLYEEACPKFAESKHLSPGVGVTLHLADCYEKLGHKASALREFRDAEKMAIERHDKRADVAHTHATALEGQVNRLTIPPPPPGGAAGAPTVLLDGEPVDAGDLGKPFPADPGAHTITVNSPGQAPRVFSVNVDPKTPVTTATIDPPEPAAEPPTPSLALVPSPPVPDAALNDAPAVQPAGHWVGAELIGVGLAGIGVGAVLIPYNKMTSTAPCDPADKKLSNWVPSIVAFSLGTVVAGAGLIVYLNAPKRTGVALVMAPAPLPGGGGATVQGSF